MRQKQIIRIAVRTLVELFRSGDLAAGFQGGASTLEGIRCHQYIQRSAAGQCPPGVTYQAEVPLHLAVEQDDLILEVGGRADGIIATPDTAAIEEIKTTLNPLDDAAADAENPVHWAQAKCYAHIYAVRQGLKYIDVQLTYVQADTRRTRSVRKTFGADELAGFFNDLIARYLQWARLLGAWAALRDKTVGTLAFPFESCRAGQQELMDAAAETIAAGGRLFAQAPTGIGKTLGTLFPAVKSLAAGESAKLFYLTAKTSTRAVAENALEQMRRQGLRLKSVTITAKEKICFRHDAECDPDTCEFARGYYDRVREGMKDIFALDAFTRPVIEEYALRHRLCPFEFSLDLSLLADCIIADYNYVFDPRVYLRRFFEETDESDDRRYTLLVDEAHNLVDRAREMFSAALSRKDVLALRRQVTKASGGKKKLSPPHRRLVDTLDALNDFFAAVRATCEESAFEGGSGEFYVEKEPPEDGYPLVRAFAAVADELLRKEEHSAFRDRLLEFYFEARSFLRTADCYDERYVSCYEKMGSDVRVKLFCVDPSHLLSAALQRGRTALFFSATLSPLEYFVNVLGGGEDAAQLSLASPFPRENLCMLLDDGISTRYRMRQFTYDHIACSVAAVAAARRGNYLVYFPSYQYLHEVYQRFRERYPEVRTVLQRSNMSDAERELFLAGFAAGTGEALVGFAVMGGVFGEGIDLVGERLSGVIVVGVGLPPIGLERNIIRDYFNEQNGKGFEYAYVYPGMNKVLQAAGRLIRTETDRGVALLIDQRFATELYQDLYPSHWHPVSQVRGEEQIREAVSRFWQE